MDNGHKTNSKPLLRLDEQRRSKGNAENPFAWNLNISIRETDEAIDAGTNRNTGEKMNCLRVRRHWVIFFDLIDRLFESYENYEFGNLGKCSEILANLEEEVEKFVENLDATNDTSDFSQALLHVIKSSQVYVSLNQTETFLPFCRLTEAAQSIVMALKAYVFFKNGLKGIPNALSYLESAIHLNPDCAEWFFLKAKILDTERLYESPKDISQYGIVFKSLESALALDRAPEYVLYGADLCSEKLHSTRMRGKESVFYNSKEWTKKSEDVAEKCERYIKEYLETKPTQAYAFFQCAKLLHYARITRNVAQESVIENNPVSLICEGFKLDSNSAFGHTVAGIIYQNRGAWNSAKIHFERSMILGPNLKGCKNLLILEYGAGNIERVKVILYDVYSKLTKSREKISWLAHIVSFHLLVDSDLLKAIVAMTLFFSITQDSSPAFTIHRSLFLHPSMAKFSLSDVLVDEVRYQLRRLPITNSELTRDYQNFLNEVKEVAQCGNIDWNSEPLGLKDEILKKNADLSSKWKPRMMVKEELYISDIGWQVREENNYFARQPDNKREFSPANGGKGSLAIGSSFGHSANNPRFPTAFGGYNGPAIGPPFVQSANNTRFPAASGGDNGTMIGSTSYQSGSKYNYSATNGGRSKDSYTPVINNGKNASYNGSSKPFNWRTENRRVGENSSGNDGAPFVKNWRCNK